MHEIYSLTDLKFSPTSGEIRILMAPRLGTTNISMISKKVNKKSGQVDNYFDHVDNIKRNDASIIYGTQ